MSKHPPKTGITHVFDDSAATEKAIRIFQEARDAREANDLLASLTFQAWIRGQKISSLPSVNWVKPLFRLVYSSFPVTSIAGSLSDGGRFNVGGSQLHPLFPGVTKFGCYAEAAPPYGNPSEFELIPNRALVLCDLSAVIATLGFPQLDHLVKKLPG